MARKEGAPVFRDKLAPLGMAQHGALFVGLGVFVFGLLQGHAINRGSFPCQLVKATNGGVFAVVFVQREIKRIQPQSEQI